MDKAWDTALTETIMQLATTSETFDLRQDVPPLGAAMFPAELADLSGRTRQPTRWRSGTGPAGRASRRAPTTGPTCDERMNFIVNLFRSRQRQAELFEPPFDATSVAALSRGEKPAGPY